MTTQRAFQRTCFMLGRILALTVAVSIAHAQNMSARAKTEDNKLVNRHQGQTMAAALIGGAPASAGPSAQAPNASPFHYQPPGGTFGDPIPFYHGGVHHVFYLHHHVDEQGRTSPGTACEWYHLVSRDLTHWEELPPALLADEEDSMIATGSIIEKEGTFFAFYCTRSRKGAGPGLAAVRMATSKDLIVWTKEPGEPLLLLKRDVPAVGTFETMINWRDPHVFWNPEVKQWWLAIAAQEKTAINYPYAGAVALATSLDLRHWTVRKEPLLSSWDGPAGECPDIFPLGNGWAMGYYPDTTRVRVADTLAGPWRRPVNDAPWGLHFLAGKTAFDGNRRIIYAYLPRTGGDFADLQYGGLMALPREVFLDKKGRLATRLVPEIIAACREDATAGQGALVFTPSSGHEVKTKQDQMALNSSSGKTAMALWEKAPANLFLTADVTLAPGSTLSLLLRGNPREMKPRAAHTNSLEDCYALTLDAHDGQVVLKRQKDYNRLPALRVQSLDLPTDRPFKLHVMLDGDILEAFVDDRISISARLQFRSGSLALLARDGSVSLNNLQIARLPDGNNTIHSIRLGRE